MKRISEADPNVVWYQEKVIDAMWRSDFYVKSAKLIIEVNGNNHFYPYTTRKDQFTNFKQLLVIASKYNLLNLEPGKLMGLTMNGETKNIDSLISRVI